MCIGTECPKCGTRMRTLNSIADKKRMKRTRYFGCPKCKYRPEKNKQVVPLTRVGWEPVRSIVETIE